MGFTKADVIDYYTRISPVLLPHLKDRPISLKRYPDGVEGFFFYEKQCPSHRPAWVNTARVPSQRRQGFIDYCVINDLSALVWAANLADLELHVNRRHKADRERDLGKLESPESLLLRGEFVRTRRERRHHEQSARVGLGLIDDVGPFVSDRDSHLRNHRSGGIRCRTADGGALALGEQCAGGDGEQECK